ncbi:MAG: alginate lyase family protein, partial [Planctomycetota bacterium]
YGQREVDIGLSDIDWTGSHIDHQEWPAQLNRFFWLQHLAVLYEHNQDEKLPYLARQTIEDWIEQHEYDANSDAAPGDNTLNVSIRLGQSCRPGWWGTVKSFHTSPHYDEEFISRMIESTRGQLDFLKHNLSSGGNWRISHLDCLLYCALIVPGLDNYQSFAVRHLNEAFHRQIHEDGSHEEHNPASYHRWMCRLFTNLWRLSQARPDLGLHLDSERVARMWDYAFCASAPDGGSCGLHDGGHWQPGPGHIPVSKPREEFLVESGLLDQRSWNPQDQPSRWFPNAGQLFLRSAWAPEATFLVFDATRWGGGHCHLSRNAISLYHKGRMLLCDPGVFSYEMSDPFAPYGKSTPAHNTITFDNMNQSEANPDTYAVQIGEEVSLIGSRYEGGYWPGQYTWGWNEGKGDGVYGVHDRLMIWIKDRGILVFDQISSDGDGQPYTVNWQFPPGPVQVDHDKRRACTQGDESNVMVQCLASSDPVEIAIHEGERDPLSGWLPQEKSSNDYQPAPLAAFEAKAAQQHSQIGTLLLPYNAKEPPDVDVDTVAAPPTSDVWCCKLEWSRGCQHIVACTPSLNTQIGTVGPLSTDASAAVISLHNGIRHHIFMKDGMILEFEDNTIIDRSSSGTCELTV